MWYNNDRWWSERPLDSVGLAETPSAGKGASLFLPKIAPKLMAKPP